MKLYHSLLLCLVAGSSAYNVSPRTDNMSDRRSLLKNVAAVAAGGALVSLTPEAAVASGGATAGKYTTIPIAKRRYYGRVQAAVHDYLLMGTELVKTQGDMTSPVVKDFFDVNGLVVVEARRQDVNGQCTKKDGNCKGAEIRDSKYNDMKTSMYLLANAFRINQTKAPDNLPTVRAAKAFFKEIPWIRLRIFLLKVQCSTSTFFKNSEVSCP